MKKYAMEGARKWFLALLVVAAGALVFAGCEWDKWGDDDDDDDHHKKGSNKETTQLPGNPGAQTEGYYTVDFVIVGGPIVPAVQTVKYGEKATEPVVRDLSNKIYTVTWYTDQLFTMPYYFSSPVIKNATLYGKWQLDSQQDVEAED